MLESLDGKISSGNSDDLDVDKDWCRIVGVKEGLYQYYEIEATTDFYSLNTGRVMAKIGVNEKSDYHDKITCRFIIIDNKPHLNAKGIDYICHLVDKLILVTTNKNHVAYSLQEKYDNLDILFYDTLNLNSLLEDIERKIVIAKLYELRQNRQIFNFDMKHFVGIHRYLFEDIYPFAGKFRTENIAKGNFSFAEWQYIEDELEKLLNKLSKDNYLKNIDKEDLAKGLAYYMAELNVLHPFREGNGRTIREFIRQLAFINGYFLDLQEIEPKDMLDACIKSVIDSRELEVIIMKCLKSINTK